MTNAKRDDNNVPTMLGVLNSDGLTVTPVKINPANNALSVDNDVTGSDNGPDHALRDENYVTTLMAVSSADGTTLIPLYVDADGKLLIDET
jgi:hypothetical protein